MIVTVIWGKFIPGREISKHEGPEFMCRFEEQQGGQYALKQGDNGEQEMRLVVLGWGEDGVTSWGASRPV